MVLDDGGHHHVVGVEPETEGEVVDRLGGVAADDGNVVPALPASEGQDVRPCLLVGGGGRA